MNKNKITQVAAVDWDVEEYHGTLVSLVGYNRDGEKVVRRHYDLDQSATQVKHDGEWIDSNINDDGGFPNEAIFEAFKDE